MKHILSQLPKRNRQTLQFSATLRSGSMRAIIDMAKVEGRPRPELLCTNSGENENTAPANLQQSIVECEAGMKIGHLFAF